MSFRIIALAGALILGSFAPALAAGAIAVDGDQGQRAGDEGYGIGWGQSRAEAASNAMEKCRSAGNDSCKVVARFDTCGAYAANRSVYGVGWGSSKDAAESMALDSCENCRIVLSECE